MFGPTCDFTVNAHKQQVFFDGGHGRLDKRLTFGAFFIEHFRYIFVGVGLKNPERQIFKFPLQLPQPQPVGQWRVQVERFLCMRYGIRPKGAFFVFNVAVAGEMPQCLKARTQANHNDANVGGHGQQHFAQGFHLVCPAQGLNRGPFGTWTHHGAHFEQFAQTGQHAAYIVAKFFLHLAFKVFVEKHQGAQGTGNPGVGVGS